MMTHRPFAAFCRNHFIDSTGNVQNIKSNSEEAKRERRERHRSKLKHQLYLLQKDLGILDKEAQKLKEEKGDTVEVQDVFKRAGKLRRRIVGIKKELKKVRG